MLKKSFTKIIFLAIAMLLFVLPSTAQALTLTPIRYEISGDPGETLEQEMTLVNETKTTQVYYASFANFEAQGDSGSPTFVDPKEGLGTWMSTELASISLASGQQKIVKFKINIPNDAEPGGHFAAIFWGTSPGAQPGQVSIGTKTGLLVLLSVNGDVTEAAGLVDFSLYKNKHFYKQLPVGFVYRFSNQGGDRVKPEGNIIVRSILGWRVKKVNANPFDGNVLPNTTRKFTPEWSKRDSLEVRDQQIDRKEKYSFTKSVKDEWHNFAVGIFRARLVAEFGSTNQVIKSKGVYFVVFPWELLLVIFVIGVPLYLLLRTLLRRYNRSVIKRAQLSFERNRSI